MHLTNYALNKLNPHFIFNKGEGKDNVGHKRSLTSVFHVTIFLFYYLYINIYIYSNTIFIVERLCKEGYGEGGGIL